MVRTANRDAGVARRGKVCLKEVRQDDREAVSGVDPRRWLTALRLRWRGGREDYEGRHSWLARLLLATG